VGIDLPFEFPNECHPPALPPEFRGLEFRDIDCQPPERSKLREDAEPKLPEPVYDPKPLPPDPKLLFPNEPELPPPELELRPEFPDWREKNPPDLASERSLIPPPLA
jgi:hypothetical protein